MSKQKDIKEKAPAKKRRSRPAKKYETQEIVQLILKDLTGGTPRSEIMRKLEDGKYKGYPLTKDYSRAWMYEQVKRAYDIIKDDVDENKKEMIDLMFARYMKIYREALDNGDRTNARQVLDSLTKLMGLNEPEKLNVNSNFEVKIDFKLDDIVIDNDKED